jgi:flagellin
MALYVNTNVTSIRSRNALTNDTNKLDTTYQRLSTGLRINSAKDDAAGLQITDRLTAQINGLDQGNRNANDGIALAQIMEGALDETTTMLQRIRVLAIQAANGTNTSIDRQSIQEEVLQLSKEITRIACKTTYAGQQILAGAGRGMLDSKGIVRFQIGAYAYDTLNVSLSTGMTLSGMAALAEAKNVQVAYESGTKGTFKPSAAKGSGLIADKKGYYFDVTSFSSAENTMVCVDALLNMVDTKRAELGAIENRMESTIRNQSNISANVSDARSRIRDTDYAEEAANMASQSIIQQAASSILTQANQKPQIALSLLQG